MFEGILLKHLENILKRPSLHSKPLSLNKLTEIDHLNGVVRLTLKLPQLQHNDWAIWDETFIKQCLADWGIDKLLTITVDNASSNDGAISYLKKKTRGWKTTVLNHEFLHLRCCAHILNLIVKDGLKQQNKSILKIRNAIRYVRSSPSRLQAFKTCASIEKIDTKSLVCLDVETRWNSTYLMLEAAVKFEKAFERLKDDDFDYGIFFALGERENDEDNGSELVDEVEGECEEKRKKKKDSKYFGPPNEVDWEVAKVFIKFLKLFYDVTLQFSGTLHVISNLFFLELVAVQTRLKNMCRHKDLKIHLMAMKMQKKFTKYWKNLDKLNFLLYAAIVLDPRYKLKFVRFCLDQVYENDNTLSDGKEDGVKNTLDRLYKHYLRGDPSKNVQNLPSSSNQAQIDVLDIDENVDTIKFLASQFVKHLEENKGVEAKSELTRYLRETCEKDAESFDVLSWWKVNSSRFPVLSQLTRDVLAILVSTVASESAFSTSGRILDPYRSSLNPEMVEALVCCQNWLRSKPTTIDIQEFMKEVSMKEAEKYEEIIKELDSSGATSIESQVIEE